MDPSKILLFNMVLNTVRLIWENCGFSELLTSGNKVYFLKFKEESNCVDMLGRGPWKIFSAPFMLKR